MAVKSNRCWYLRKHPVGLIKDGDLELVTEEIPALKDGQFRIRNIYLGLEPAYRGWMEDIPNLYRPPVKLDHLMEGLGLGVVEESTNPNYSVGDLVSGMIQWQEYVITDGTESGAPFMVLPKLDIPLTAFMSILSMHGLTAYVGLLEVAKLKEGETLCVTAGAGAVGSLVGQIGKIKGAKVIGIAGTQEKCQWIKEELHFDEAINYREESIDAKLKEYAPQGIDVLFENVGGEIMDTILGHMKNQGRVALCGMISQYNLTEPPPGPKNFINILLNRLRVEGFVVLDHGDKFPEILQQLGGWYAQGRLSSRVDIVEGLENAPLTMNKLFEGSNQGKLIIKISEEA